MKRKKFLCLLLTMAMAVSMLLSAYAAEAPYTPAAGTAATQSESGDTISQNYTSGLKAVTLALTVPTTGDALLLVNPYEMTVITKAADGDTPAVTSTEQILSPIQYITNKTPAALSVSLSVAGSIPEGSNAAFASKVVGGNSTEREVFLFAQFATTTAKGGSGDDKGDPIPPTFRAYNEYDKDKGDILVGEEKVEKADFLTLPKVVGTGTNGAIEPQDANFIAFQMKGNCATNPSTAWSAADTVKVAYVFTFAPTVLYAVTTTAADSLATIDKSTAMANSTVTITAAEGKSLKTPTVAATDANNEPETPTEVSVVEADKSFSFKMPGYPVTVTIEEKTS